MVATVERGLLERDFWSMEIAGERPVISSTSGFCIWRKNWRAYAESDSTYLRWPSAKIVSKAKDDFPDPESPVNTIILLRGNVRSMFLRLCSRAPLIIILSCILLTSIKLRCILRPQLLGGKINGKRLSSQRRNHPCSCHSCTTGF